MSFNSSSFRGPVAAFARPRNLIALGLCAICLYLASSHLGGVEFHEIAASVAEVSAGQWLVALTMTVGSFAAVGQYDALFHRWIGTGVDGRRAALSGASAIALSQTLGMGIATGTVARWRSLPELSLAEALKLTNYVSFSFMAALGLLTASLMIFVPAGGPVNAGTFAGIAVGLTVLAACLSLATHGWLPFRLPPLRLMGRLIVLAALDIGCAALALWMLLPIDTTLAFPVLLIAFVIGLGGGLLSGAPGGVGPFELCLLTMLPALPEPDLIAAVLAFRLVYYALPACLGLLVLAHPAWRERQKHLPAPALGVCRVEAGGLLLQPGHSLIAAGSRVCHVAEASQTLVGIGEPASGGIHRHHEIDALRTASAQRMLWPALYKVKARSAVNARRKGWQVAAISEEAWLEVAAFSTEGPRRRQLRRKLKNVGKAGVMVRVERSDSLPVDEMAQIARAWAERSGGERGFSMGRFAPAYIAAQRCLTARSGGRLVAFVTFHTGPDEWVLDLMRSGNDIPDGTMHCLITEAIAMARAEGVARVSLAAMSLAVPPWPFGRIAPDAAGLRRFKLSFAPRLSTLYIAAPNRLGLALAALDILLRIHLPGPPPPGRFAPPRPMQNMQGGPSETSVVNHPPKTHVSANQGNSNPEVSI